MIRKRANIGNVGTEEVEQLKSIVTTRDAIRATADVLFGSDAKKARAEATKDLDKLFVQAPIAQRRMSMQKTASVDAFLAKTAAQRYPELQKVARPSLDLKTRKSSDTAGTNPVRSGLRGGSS